MANEATSRQVWNASELLVLAPVKQGFVPTTLTMSYASRLRLLLTNLYKSRRLAVERDQLQAAGPIERLQTLFDSQWTVLPDDKHLLVTVSFGSSWELYFQRLVRDAGPALDLIFRHCEGYEDYACVGPDRRLRYQGFARWVREHQLSCDFYYPTAPEVTVDDITYMRKRAAQRDVGSEAAAELQVEAPEEESKRQNFESVVRAIMAKDPGLDRQAAEQIAEEKFPKERAERTRATLKSFFQLRDTFPEPLDPDGVEPTVFDVAVRNLVPEVAYLELDAPRNPFESWMAGVKELTPAPTQAPEPIGLSPDEMTSIQGNILTGYEHMTHGCVVLLRCDGADQASQFLANVAARVTTEASAKGKGPFTNLAVTFPGLQRMGLDSALIERFPKEFREGMEERSGTLGDLGYPSHPEHWERPEANWSGPGAPLGRGRPLPLSAVDFVAVLEMRSPGADHGWPAHPLHDSVVALEEAGAQILHVQILQRPDSEVVYEHFGFADGLSQPVPNAVLDGRALEEGGVAPRDVVALGELLLGYPDARGEVRWCADEARSGPSAELFQNGSFLVFRKLEQDVAAFEEFAKENQVHVALSQREIKERVVGRTEQGQPLVAPPPAGNDFDYADDAVGSRCPLHAHIRRANPRTEGATAGSVPRIMRRGFSYGPRYAKAPEEKRGLMFMAFNASIASQFEVIQGWINGGNATGIQSAQRDLFTGSPQPASVPHWVRDGAGWQALVPPRKEFVSLRWGLYTFVPSKKGLEWLAGPKAEASRQAGRERQLRELVEGGNRIIEELEKFEQEQGSEPANLAWRSVIEESSKAMQAVAVWAAVRARGGVLRTPYGVLVGSKEGAEEVLSGDGHRFSVREYWHRLGATTGEHYIAFDPRPDVLQSPDPEERQKHRDYEERLAQPDVGHHDFGQLPNDYIVENWNDTGPFGRQASRARARALATEILDDSGGRVNLRSLALVVVARLSRDWFGVPDVAPGVEGESQQLAEGILPVVLASQYVFQPHPEETLRKTAEGAERASVGGNSEFHRYLEGRGCPMDRIQSTMVGSSVGFAAPAVASVVTVMRQWIRTGTLAAVAEAWRAGKDLDALEKAVVGALMRTPVPTLLYRTAMPGASVSGQAIQPGTLTIVGLGSAAFADPPQSVDWLFGGPRETNPHGCPGRGAAMGVIVGIVASLLDQDDLRQDRGLIVRFRK